MWAPQECNFWLSVYEINAPLGDGTVCPRSSYFKQLDKFGLKLILMVKVESPSYRLPSKNKLILKARDYKFPYYFLWVGNLDGHI